MDPTTILAAGVASGTILLFAAIGEIFAERSGVLNLGVEGMMLIGAVAGFSIAASTGQPWLGLAVAMLAGGLLSLIHGVMTIHFRADQVVSGLALTFLGTGLARVLGEGLSSAKDVAQLPHLTIPVVSGIPLIGPGIFTNQSVLVYVGYLLVPAGLAVDRADPAGTPPAGRRRGTGRRGRPGHRRLSDALCVRVHRRAAGRPRRSGHHAVDLSRAGSATRPSTGAAGSPSGSSSSPSGVRCEPRSAPCCSAPSSSSSSTSRASASILGFENPFQAGRSATFFLEMLPYLMVIVVVVIGSRDAVRKRVGAPAALGRPYVRGERGA